MINNMLITKEVEVELSGTNIEYFENKGYEIPRRVDKQGRENVKRGTKIKVKVEDLKDNSDALVSVQCDDSGEILENVEWKVYKYHVKENGEYYYNKPHNNLFRKIRKKKYLGRGLSFYDWCYENLPKEMADCILDRWDYSLNIDKNGNVLGPKDVGRGSDGFNKKKRGYWFKCLEHPEHGSELKNIGRFTNNFQGFMGSIECIQCNAISITHPESVKYLKNTEDSLIYSAGSNESVVIKCPDCGYEKEMVVNALISRGFACPICSDHFPYSEKYFANFLKQVVDQRFLIQLTKKTFKWCDKYKYDFYLDDINGIVETHGLQHYEQTSGMWGTVEEIQANDKDKEELAKVNEIENYIVIDCRKSEMNWIKDSIMKSDLPELLNFKESDIDWLKCHEAGCKNMVKVVCDIWHNGTHDMLIISDILKIGTQTIMKYLKQGTELGWCYYNAKEENCTKVVCVNTGEIFDSQTEACNKYNLAGSSGISSCCSNNNIRKTSGRLSDGTKLVWMIYEDYILKTKEEIENILIESQEGGRKVKVVCLTTREIFNTMMDASVKYNVPYGSISSCCRKASFSTGVDLITGQPLVWMYYDEYLEINK